MRDLWPHQCSKDLHSLVASCRPFSELGFAQLLFALPFSRLSLRRLVELIVLYRGGFRSLVERHVQVRKLADFLFERLSALGCCFTLFSTKSSGSGCGTKRTKLYFTRPAALPSRKEASLDIAEAVFRYA